MKKTFFILVPALFLLNACGGSGLEVEQALPADADMYFVMDFDGGSARNDFDKILKRFPEAKFLEDRMEEELKAEDSTFNYKNFSDVVKGDWEIGMAMNFNEADFQEDVAEVKEFKNPEVGNVNIALKVDKADKFLTLLDLKGWKYEKEGDFEYWTNEDPLAGNKFWVRNRDFFVYSGDLSGLEATKERLISGKGGFDSGEVEEKAAKLMKNLIGYLYVSEDFSNKAAYQEMMGMNMGAFGDAFVVLGVDDVGFKIASESIIPGGPEDFAKLIPNYEKGLKLIDHVNAEGVFLYEEVYGLGAVMKNFLSQVPEAKAKEDLLPVLDGAFAVSFAHKGGVLPSVEAYFTLDEDDEKAAESFVKMVDDFANSTIAQFDTALAANQALAAESGNIGAGEVPAGLIKKDVVVVKGGALHRVYLDTEAFLAAGGAQAAMLGNFLKGQKVEFYYGVTGDNVLVAALTPDLGVRYGKDVLADDKQFIATTKGFNDGYSLAYFRSEPLVKYLSQFKGLMKIGGLTDEELAVYDEFLRWVSTVNSGVSAGYFEDGIAKSEGILKIVEQKAK